MAASHDPTNPEKEEKVSANASAQSGELKKVLDNFTINLPIAADGERMSIRLFPSNPHFNDAVESIFKPPMNPGTEWHFIHELHRASHLPLDQQVQEEKRLLEKYVTNRESLSALDLPTDLITEIQNGSGLDRFLPILQKALGSGETFSKQVAGNIAQNNQMSAEHAEKLRVAFEHDIHDKLVLPVRTIICNALNAIEELEIKEDKARKEEVAQSLKKLEEIESKEKSPEKTRVKPMFSKSIYPEVEASNQKIEMIKKQLNELFETSIQQNDAVLRRMLKEIAEESGLWTILGELLSKLSTSGPETENRHAQKIRDFINMLDNINKDIDKLNAKTLVLASAEQIQKYMKPIEEACEKKAAAARSAGKVLK